MKRYNIAKPRKYTAKDGTEKTVWDTVGTMIEFEKQGGGVSRKIEIPAIGLEAQVFPVIQKNEKPADSQAPTHADEENIDPADIPF